MSLLQLFDISRFYPVNGVNLLKLSRFYPANPDARLLKLLNGASDNISDNINISPGISRGNGLISLLGMLAATVVILFLAWRASRWIAAHGVSSGFGGTEKFRILYLLPLAI